MEKHLWHLTLRIVCYEYSLIRLRFGFGKNSGKIEPYLIFLNIHQLERQGADIRTKVEELEELNQSLRKRDKVKDDAIAQLSDQLVLLSVRLQEIERRQVLV